MGNFPQSGATNKAIGPKRLNVDVFAPWDVNSRRAELRSL